LQNCSGWMCVGWLVTNGYLHDWTVEDQLMMRRRMTRLFIRWQPDPGADAPLMSKQVAGAWGGGGVAGSCGEPDGLHGRGGVGKLGLYCNMYV
jgi:hypothetical protein